MGGERSSGGGTSQEIEIVFKLHPNMLQESEDSSMKEVVNIIKDNATRYIKTTSKALVEHLCKYLAMRIDQNLSCQMKSYNNLKVKKKSLLNKSVSSSKCAEKSIIKDLVLYIASLPTKWTPLSTSLSLIQVNEKYWKVNKPMEMFYS